MKPMTPDQRREQLVALKTDLQAELDEVNRKFKPISVAYDRWVHRKSRLEDQVKRVEETLNWFGKNRDTEPFTEADEPEIPF